jgi:hypothetical protein
MSILYDMKECTDNILSPPPNLAGVAINVRLIGVQAARATIGRTAGRAEATIDREMFREARIERAAILICTCMSWNVEHS